MGWGVHGLSLTVLPPAFSDPWAPHPYGEPACDRSSRSRPTLGAPDRNLAMGLVRVTEAAAMAAGRWMGRGTKRAPTAPPCKAMRVVLQTVAMDGVVVIGEGEKDHAPMLYNGERIGDGSPP